MSLAQEIKRKALEIGFDLVGITDASPIDSEQVGLLVDWLKSGFAGEMKYMLRNFEKRIDPVKLLENAQSIICVGLNYKPPKQKSKAPDPIVPIGKVSSYAQYEDYHPFIKERLRKLIEFVGSVTDRDNKFKICVDSVPLAERAFAVRAGLGFIGKNHMLINPELGPEIFLGEIITTLKLSANEPFIFHSERKKPLALSGVEGKAGSRNLFKKAECSNCDKCINACPTGALGADGHFEANKCISYLTIEHKGRIHPYLSEKIDDRLFGCDECVLACPWQEDAPVCKNKQFRFYNDRAKLDLERILNLSKRDFDAEFADTTIKRIGLERLKRNAGICLSNINRSS